MSVLSIQSHPRDNLKLMAMGNYATMQFPAPEKIQPATPSHEIMIQDNSADCTRTMGCVVIIISSLALATLYGHFLHPAAYSIALIGVIPLYIVLHHCRRPSPVPRTVKEPSLPKVIQPLPEEDKDAILNSVAEYLMQQREEIIKQVHAKMSSTCFGPPENRLTPKASEEQVLDENPDYAHIIQLARQAKDSIPKIESGATTDFIEVCATVCGTDEAKLKRVVCFFKWSDESYSPTVKEASRHPYSSVVQQKNTIITDQRFVSFTGPYSTPKKPPQH